MILETIVSVLLLNTNPTGSLNNPMLQPLNKTPAFESAEPTPIFPYDMTFPYAYFELDDIVKNISGLTASKDNKTITCIQSEDGKSYDIDRKTGKVVGSTFFITEGEFQGIEIVGDTMFAIKGSGQLFKIWNLKSAHKNVKAVRTNLQRTESIEGLGYDLMHNRLLMTSKGQKEGDFSKKIYEFDVKTNSTNPIPAYEITLAGVKGFLTEKKNNKEYLKLYEEYVSKTNAKSFDFVPSSVAVHPINQNIYVLSSVNSVLLVMDQQGNIIEMTKLKKELHIAPSGLCFDEEGTMYISNEAKDNKPAKLYEYKMKKDVITASRR
jgi:uncharacterized protein YjiK